MKIDQSKEQDLTHESFVFSSIKETFIKAFPKKKVLHNLTLPQNKRP